MVGSCVRDGGAKGLFGSPVFPKLPHKIEPTSVWKYAKRLAQALEENTPRWN